MTTTRPSVQLNLIGGFELLCGDRAQDVPESAKRLVAFLGLHRKPRSRLFVAGSLWPDKPDLSADARKSVTPQVWRYARGCAFRYTLSNCSVSTAV